MQYATFGCLVRALELGSILPGYMTGTAYEHNFTVDVLCSFIEIKLLIHSNIELVDNLGNLSVTFYTTLAWTNIKMVIFIILVVLLIKRWYLNALGLQIITMHIQTFLRYGCFIMKFIFSAMNMTR